MSARSQRSARCFALGLACVLAACSPTIDLPAPAELTVSRVAAGTVELAWSLVVRVDGYELHYSTDGSGPPYRGRGLRIVPTSGRCAPPDGGQAVIRSLTSDLGSADRSAQTGDRGAPDSAGSTPDKGTLDRGRPTPDRALLDRGAPDQGPDRGPRDAGADLAAGGNDHSPLRLNSRSCMDVENSHTEAGMIPVSTPGKRPRARLAGLVPGQTYAFSLRAYRGQTRGPFGPKVTHTAQ